MKIRIKILYIATICAIITFLCMQAYWLYVRYDYALTQTETDVYKSVMSAAESYHNTRNSLKSSRNPENRITDNYNTNISGDTVTANITTWQYHLNAYDILGKPRGQELTNLEKKHVAREILDIIDNGRKRDTLSAKEFTLTGVPRNFDIMGALAETRLDDICPFTEAGIDSCLRHSGIAADITLSTLDTILWSPALSRHTSVFDPTVEIALPYDILEKQAAVIVYHIPASEVLGRIWGILLITVIVTLMLVTCLCLQIRTIVHQQRLDTMRNNFVTTMIHELKRPIATLKMCVSALDNERLSADIANRRSILADSREALDNLSGYFSKLRDITFNDSTLIPLNRSRFNASQAIRRTAAMISIPSDKEVRYSIAESDITIDADPIHFANIIGNLIENAIKYSPQQVDITISTAASEHNVTITITDTGFGISSKDLDRIFDKYFRAADTNHTPGMGLGLTYVKMLVEAHGGTISISSRKGCGSTFTIDIPQ